MPRPADHALVEPDTVASIKKYCWDNMTLFHARHRERLDMAYPTFAKAMRLQETSQPVVDRIEETAKVLGLIGGKLGDFNYYDLEQGGREIMKAIDAILAEPSIENIEKLRTVANDFGGPFR